MIDIDKVKTAIQSVDNTADLDDLVKAISESSFHPVDKQELASFALWKKQSIMEAYIQNTDRDI